MEVRGKTVAVVGLGRSGVAAAKLLSDLGARVIGSDVKEKGGLLLNDLEERGVELVLGGTPPSLLESDLIVVSPGVPPWARILKEADLRGVEVVGEVELASWFLKGDTVAITGTNGKTTTVALLGEILKKGGRKVATGGNIHPGSPLSDLVKSSEPDGVTVCEISTFQLERMNTFRPKTAVFLNISPDHLDRHKDFDTYLSLKAKLFSNQNSGDFAVLNRDDGRVLQATRSIKAQKVFFSRKGAVDNGAWIEAGSVFSSTSGLVCHEDDIPLRGGNILEDVLASVAVSDILGVEGGVAAETIMGFRGVVHRMEEVETLGDVRFVNNSMCTNQAAFTSSLDAFREPIILICGGKDKGGGVEEIAVGIESQAKAAILIGESGDRLRDLLRKRGYRRAEKAQSMDEAVREAFKMASPGDIVLLSPGFASFDWFEDFAERGEEFKKAVRRLKDEL